MIEPPEPLDMGTFRAGHRGNPQFQGITSKPPDASNSFTVTRITATEPFTPVFAALHLPGALGRGVFFEPTPIALPATVPVLDNGQPLAGDAFTNYGVEVTFHSPTTPSAHLYEGTVELELENSPTPYVIPVKAVTARVEVSAPTKRISVGSSVPPGARSGTTEV